MAASRGMRCHTGYEVHGEEDSPDVWQRLFDTAVPLVLKARAAGFPLFKIGFTGSLARRAKHYGQHGWRGMATVLSCSDARFAATVERALIGALWREKGCVNALRDDHGGTGSTAPTSAHFKVYVVWREEERRAHVHETC